METPDGEVLREIATTRAVGEMGVITGQPRQTRVVADEESTVLQLSSTDLQELIDGDPELGYQLLLSLVKTLYGRTSRANDDIINLQRRCESLRQRLAELAPDDPLLAEE